MQVTISQSCIVYILFTLVPLNWTQAAEYHYFHQTIFMDDKYAICMNLSNFTLLEIFKGMQIVHFQILLGVNFTPHSLPKGLEFNHIVYNC